MTIQDQWRDLCRAYERKDWDALEDLLEQVVAHLDGGEPPIIDNAVSNGFNLAMARAGVEYIRSHFRRTTEWPTLETNGETDNRFA